MNSNTSQNKESCRPWHLNGLIIRSFIVFSLFLFGVQTHLQAQGDQYSRPSFWFGASAAANVNLYGGSIQELNSDFTSPVPFTDGLGVVLTMEPFVEFQPADSRWSIMLKAGFDDRAGDFKEIITSTNNPVNLSVDLNYISIEPILKIIPFKKGLYFFGGPRLAFNFAKSFRFMQGVNPAAPDQSERMDVAGELSHVNPILLSMQLGFGFDLKNSSRNEARQYVLSPFVSFQPSFGQTPRTIETWSMTTFRAGVAFKLGSGRLIQ